MRHWWGRLLLCALGGALVVVSNGYGQEPKSANGLRAVAGQQAGREEQARVAAQKEAIAESIIAREEAASRRAFDPGFRAEAKIKLASRSFDELESIRVQSRGLGIKAYGSSQADLVYTPVTPCRIIDTRLAGGAIAAGTTRDFLVTGTDYSSQGGSASGCGIPSGPATAAVINFVAVIPAGMGHLRVTPFGTAIPLAAFINYAVVPELNIANGLAVTICDPAVASCAFDITIQADTNAVQLVADIEGYFKLLPTAGRAYALVDPIGLALIAASTKNFTSVRRPSTGVYCLTAGGGIAPSSFGPAAFVTVEWGFSTGNSLAAFDDSFNTNDCLSTEFEVQTYDFSGTLSNGVAFRIFVP